VTAPSTIKVAAPSVTEADLDAVRAALASGQLASGSNVAELERRFAAYVGTREAVAVNSGTAAIHAALAAAGLGPGDEVIVPPLTFFSTISAVIHQGGVPVFADIDPRNFCLDPADVERRVTPRTRAILPVHYFGHAADMDGLRAVAEREHLWLIEDAAQAHGTTHRGRRTGSMGEMGCFSFFATKHMTTGEGGMVTTDDGDLADHMRCFRSHGMRGRHEHAMLGHNYRMPELAAALGRTQLDRLDRLNADRIAVTHTLIERLRDLSWLTPPNVPAHVEHTYFWCHLLIDETALGMATPQLIERLAHEGVEVRYRYREPLYRQPVLKNNVPLILRCCAGDHLPDYANLHLPNAESVAGRIIGLPNRPDMTAGEIDRVVAALSAQGPEPRSRG